MSRSTPAGVIAFREPRLLPRGARIALVSPSGPLRGVEDVDRAIANAAAFGWRTMVGSHALSRTGYFAGQDAERVEDLLWALTDPAIDGIWCLRGGYGAARLLPFIPIDLVSSSAKPLLGYSDITALHALWARAGLVSYHAPTARAHLPDATATLLFDAAGSGSQTDPAMPDALTLVEGRATGRLCGGNLALAASLCGTPWAIDFRGGIAVFEDINESSYRIDRMLTQLRLAGTFEGCAGLVFGQFTACSPHSDDGERAVRDVLAECAAVLGVPAVMNAPFGHVDDQWTLPLGALVTLDVPPAAHDANEVCPTLSFHRRPARQPAPRSSS